MGGGPQCVSVELRDAERAIKALKSLSLMARDYKPVRLGGRLLIPVVDSSEAVEHLATIGIGVEGCEASFPLRKKPRRLRELGFHGVSGYSLVGDIAVFSRRLGGPPLEVYREAAQALLDENRGVRSAYLKEYTGGDYRVQSLVHLAGEERTTTVHKEYGLEFEVDIARVYFNPRLAGEHRAIADSIGEGEKVLDMFSGVGGFSIHAASLRRVWVVANDLNPHAAMLAARNARRNRRRLKGVVAVMRSDASKLPAILRPVFNTIIMNHPTASRNFAVHACRLTAGKSRIIYYTLSTSCHDARDEAFTVFNHRCCGAVEVGWCKNVVDYSPSMSVYRVEVGVKGAKL
ncbi:MAG: class I SAM-dependent methyltransferase family protein [Aeropyrum sp.]|nr:class I SAM-dependent methyltransferase family protein [Aeropyrum sp.]